MKTKKFNLSEYKWKHGINYRKQPKKYHVGKGEHGVLICEPYKSEIVKHWRFKTVKEALISSKIIYLKFLDYLRRGEFVGADMARKFLQMGFTRARRYANYAGGRKYDKDTGNTLTLGTGDPEKAKSAKIFLKRWRKAEEHPQYLQEKAKWKKTIG